ncbi:MAG: DmsC/YnfH family molybdoenzyme membrane anchor subunit [Pseudomonadota bacterium]
MQWGATSRLQRFWDIRAACNFIGGGTGSSLLVWAALGLMAGLPYFPAALIGLSFVGAGLFMVWLEIGKPWRAFNVFFRPQTSWMTREGMVALPLIALGAIAVLFDARVQLSLTTPSPVVPALLTAMLGLAFLYCQLRILHSARGLPAWREPWAMPLIGLSGLTEGLGLYLLLATVLGFASVVMTAILLALLIARALAWRAYIAGLSRAGVPESTMAALTAMHSGFLVAGHVLPMILIVLAYIWPGMNTICTTLAGIAAVLAGWWLKIILVTRAAYIPATVVPHPPVRGRPGPSNGAHRTT